MLKKMIPEYYDKELDMEFPPLGDISDVLGMPMRTYFFTTSRKRKIFKKMDKQERKKVKYSRYKNDYSMILKEKKEKSC